MTNTVISKTKQVLKERYFVIILSIVLFILNTCIFKITFHDFEKSKRCIILLAAFIIFEILGIILIFSKKFQNIHFENKFLLLIIPLGLMFMIALPVGTAPDETNHFRRAYEISEGHLISSQSETGAGGAFLPADIMNFQSGLHYSELWNNSSINAEETTFQLFSNTSLYSPICYIPQVLGILIGRFLHLPVILIFYLARLTNFACWVAIIYFVIKKTPLFKKGLFLIMCTPISLQAAISCQADGLTNAIAVALLAFVLFKIKSKTLLTKKENIIMAALAIVMTCCKIVYLPLCLILFLLPKECFKNNKDKFLRIGILGAVVIVLNLIWLVVSSRYLVEFNPGVDSGAQVAYVIGHPIRYLFTIVDTTQQYGLGWYLSAFGDALGPFSISLSQVYILLYSLFVFYVFCRDEHAVLVTALQKASIIAIILCCVILIFTSLYVQWTAVGAPMVDGIQGRYFIPLIPFILLLFHRPGKKNTDDRVVFLCNFMLILYAVFSTATYFI